MPPKKKKGRPKFAAPKPPIPPPSEELVENETPSKNMPAKKTEKKAPKKEEEATPAKAPTPPKKLVKEEDPDPKKSPLEGFLAEVTEDEPQEDEPAEESKTEPKDEPEENKDEPALPDPEPKKPKKTAKKKSGGSGFGSALVIFFLIILGATGWAMYFKEKGTVNFTLPPMPSIPFLNSAEPTPTPSPIEPDVTLTPTPNPRAETYLEVLNGSGVAGAAGQTATALEELGYQILEVGNASSQNYEESEVYTAEDFTDETTLITDLLDTFGDATVSGLLEDDSSTASARIIVGKNWQE